MRKRVIITNYKRENSHLVSASLQYEILSSIISRFDHRVLAPAVKHVAKFVQCGNVRIAAQPRYNKHKQLINNKFIILTLTLKG
jgi:hypothetical protein